MRVGTVKRERVPRPGLMDVRQPQPEFPLETAGLVKGRVPTATAPSEMGQVPGEGASDSQDQVKGGKPRERPKRSSGEVGVGGGDAGRLSSRGANSRGLSAQGADRGAGGGAGEAAQGRSSRPAHLGPGARSPTGLREARSPRQGAGMGVKGGKDAGRKENYSSLSPVGMSV